MPKLWTIANTEEYLSKYKKVPEAVLRRLIGHENKAISLKAINHVIKHKDRYSEDQLKRIKQLIQQRRELDKKQPQLLLEEKKRKFEEMAKKAEKTAKPAPKGIYVPPPRYMMNNEPSKRSLNSIRKSREDRVLSGEFETYKNPGSLHKALHEALKQKGYKLIRIKSKKGPTKTFIVKENHYKWYKFVKNANEKQIKELDRYKEWLKERGGKGTPKQFKEYALKTIAEKGEEGRREILKDLGRFVEDEENKLLKSQDSIAAIKKPLQKNKLVNEISTARGTVYVIKKGEVPEVAFVMKKFSPKQANEYKTDLNKAFQRFGKTEKAYKKLQEWGWKIEDTNIKLAGKEKRVKLLLPPAKKVRRSEKMLFSKALSDFIKRSKKKIKKTARAQAKKLAPVYEYPIRQTKRASARTKAMGRRALKEMRKSETLSDVLDSKTVQALGKGAGILSTEREAKALAKAKGLKKAGKATKRAEKLEKAVKRRKTVRKAATAALATPILLEDDEPKRRKKKE